MNNTLKKVFSYIGVAFASSLVTLGAVIGISSCSQQQGHKVDAATETQYRVYKYTYFGVNLTSTDVSDFFSLSDMPAGESIFSYIYDFDGTFENANDNQSVVHYTHMAYTMAVQNESTDTYSSLMVTKLSIRDEYDNWVTLYDWGNNISFNTDYVLFKAHTMRNYGYVESGHVTLTESRPQAFIDFFSYVIASGNPSLDYRFNDTFNYNAFAQGGVHTTNNLVVHNKYPFVAFGSVDVVEMTITYDMPIFVSGGNVFNRIEVYFLRATPDLKFKDSNGLDIQSHLIDGTNPYKYFKSMKYVNTYNSYVVEVASREKVADSSNTYIYYNASWLGEQYKTLSIYGSLDTYTESILSMANNNIDLNGFSTGNYQSDIGLGSVFALLTTTFQSFIPLMSIQIIPGITIGLLLFMPLIAGIIILIVWIVKR